MNLKKLFITASVVVVLVSAFAIAGVIIQNVH